MQRIWTSWQLDLCFPGGETGSQKLGTSLTRQSNCWVGEPCILLLFLLPCAASTRLEQRQALPGRGLWAVYPAQWGWLWQGLEVGGVGALEERRSLTTRTTFKACSGAGWGEWKATVCQSVQPWQGHWGLIRKCCSLPASGAGTEPCAHRTELPLWW